VVAFFLCSRRAAQAARSRSVSDDLHPGGNPGANLKSISHKCYLFEEAFVWELTKETLVLPLGCLQDGIKLNPVQANTEAQMAKWMAAAAAKKAEEGK